MNKKVGKFLGRAFNTSQVEILVPKDVRNQFVHGFDKPKHLRGKPISKFKTSLQTENFAEAEI